MGGETWLVENYLAVLACLSSRANLPVPWVVSHLVLLTFVQTVDCVLQVVGQGGLEGHFLASLWIYDGKSAGVQRLAFQDRCLCRQVKATLALKLCRMNLAVPCIKAVTDNRAANVCQMNS